MEKKMEGCIICGEREKIYFLSSKLIDWRFICHLHFFVCSQCCTEKYCAEGLASRIVQRLFFKMGCWTDRILISDTDFFHRLMSYCYNFNGDY